VYSCSSLQLGFDCCTVALKSVQKLGEKVFSIQHSGMNMYMKLVMTVGLDNLSRVQCSHITQFINILRLLPMIRHNDIDHVLIDERLQM
jgi:hypothetical protein